MNYELRLSMFIPREVYYYIHLFEKYMPGLEARSQDGDILPVIPDTEFAKRLGLDIQSLRGLLVDYLGVEENQLTNVTIIVLPKHEDAYYEELTLSWSLPIEFDETLDGISKGVVLNPTFSPILGSSLYVDIRVHQKYEFQRLPKVFRLAEERLGFEQTEIAYSYIPMEDAHNTILQDRRRYVFRFDRNYPNLIQITCVVSIPTMVRIWSWFGLGLGAGVIALIWLSQAKQIFPITFPLVAATIAILIGFRIILLGNIELLTRWNWIYIILVTINVLLVIFFGFIKL